MSNNYYWHWPIPVATKSKVWVCSLSLAGIVDSNPAGGMDVCYECCVLSGTGLCNGLIPHTEESSAVCVCVCVCVLRVIRCNSNPLQL